MNKYYNSVIEKLNKETNYSVKFTSDTILNNILISRDLNYIYKWNIEECRITISYYKHINDLWPYSTFALKSNKIHLYTGLSKRVNWKSLCRYLIEK